MLTHSDADRFIRLDEVTRLVGLKSSRLYELIKEGTFPRQIRIGGAARWSLLEILHWQDECRAKRDETDGGVK